MELSKAGNTYVSGELTCRWEFAERIENGASVAQQVSRYDPDDGYRTNLYPAV